MKHCILLLLVGCCIQFGVNAQGSQQLRDRKIGRMVTTIVDIRNGKKQERLTCATYDRKGRLVELKEMDKDSTILNWELYEYDRKGNEICFIEKNNAGKELKKFLRTFDKWKHEKTQMTWEKGELKEISTSAYDRNGNKIEEQITDANHQLIKSIRYEYDNQDLLIKRIIKNSEGEIIYSKEVQYETR